MRQKYINGEIYELNLDEVLLDPGQPKSDYDENEAIDKIARAISHDQFIQPVFFRLNEAGKPTLLLGGRRYKAARKAGLTSIPGIYCDREQCEVLFVRNLLLADLTPIQEAEALRQALAYGYTRRQLASVLGKTEEAIRSSLSLLKLPRLILEICRDDPSYDRGLLLAIAGLPSEEMMRELFALFSNSAHSVNLNNAADKESEEALEALLNTLIALTLRIKVLSSRGDHSALTRIHAGLNELVQSGQLVQPATCKT